MKLIDLTGKRFGKLTVTRRHKIYNGYRPQWDCLCDCGSSVVVDGLNLRNGSTQSCGCIQRHSAESFWALVDKRSADDCWEWKASCGLGGYGQVKFQGVVGSAHRVAAMLAGLIQNVRSEPLTATSILVLHKCDNRKCCNPNHLFLGTQKDNVRDAFQKGRRAGLRGENHPSAKLTFEQASEIRELRKTGRTQRSLAEEYGVSRSQIRKIESGRGY